MVVAFTYMGVTAHEPPYTEEEEMAIYKAMAGGLVAMTSVTRPSNATTPVSTPVARRRPAKPSK